MLSVQTLTRPVMNSGLGRNIKTKALALAAVATMVPAIANAQTKAPQEPEKMENSIPAQRKTAKTHIQTYYMTPNYHNGNAYNVSGNQLGIKAGADYNYNAVNNAQGIGPFINMSGKTAGVVNGVCDIDAKASFNIPSAGDKIANLGAYAAAGAGVDIIRHQKNRLSADIAGEAFVNSDVNKINSSTVVNTEGYHVQPELTDKPTYDIQSQTTAHRFDGNYGYGARFRLTGQHGIKSNTRITESAHVAYGVSNNLNSVYNITHDGDNTIFYDELNTHARYLRAGGDITFDFGNVSVGAYGGYQRTYEQAPVTGEKATSDSWGGGARVAFRFGN